MVSAPRAEGLHAFEYRTISTPGEAASAAAASPGVSVVEGTGCLPADPKTPVYIEGQIDIWSALAGAGVEAA